MIELKGPWAAKATEPANLYLDLLARLLYGGLYEQVLYPVAATPRGRKHRVFEPIRRLLASRGLVLARSMRIVPERFATSPPPRIPVAETMVGPRGLQNIRECVDNVLDDGVPGDLIEAGVWRGGATVFMRALLQAREHEQDQLRRKRRQVHGPEYCPSSRSAPCPRQRLSARAAHPRSYRAGIGRTSGRKELFVGDSGTSC
jgi:hypothetical protein